jgi:hypothetical protein
MTSLDPATAVRTEQHRHPAAFTDFIALPEAATEDVADVRQVLSLIGHTIDNGAWDELAPLLAPEAELAEGDVTVTGREAIVAHFSAQDDLPAHHTVNVVTRAVGADVVAWSRLVRITGGGHVTSADAIDRFARADDGWQVVRRTVLPKHSGPHPGDDVAAGWLA